MKQTMTQLHKTGMMKEIVKHNSFHIKQSAIQQKETSQGGQQDFGGGWEMSLHKVY